VWEEGPRRSRAQQPPPTYTCTDCKRGFMMNSWLAHLMPDNSFAHVRIPNVERAIGKSQGKGIFLLNKLT
jgi:hypothetical protein